MLSGQGAKVARVGQRTTTEEQGLRMRVRYRAIGEILRLLFGVLLLLGASPMTFIRVDDWGEAEEGLLQMTRNWSFYPSPAKRTIKTPPRVVVDGDRKVLQLKTDHESVGLWRALAVDVRTTPRLVWQWKPLVLPEGGCTPLLEE